MKYWYYAIDDQQNGPFTLEELKPKRLKKSTLVWTEGMDDWANADNIDELKDILVSEPPPLPKKQVTEPPPLPIKPVISPPPIVETPVIDYTEATDEKPYSAYIKQDRYDRSYRKESEATITGILLLFITPLITLHPDVDEILPLIVLVLFVVRISITIWVVNIATRQNRDGFVWGFLAFFAPAIALIIIGLLNKIRKDEPYIITEKYAYDENTSLRGRYFIESSEINEKIGQLDYTMYPFNYKSGLAGVEIINNLHIYQPQIQLHKKGFHIELKTKDKRYHNLVISFHEIKDISYRKDNKLITCHLSDDNTLKISYDPESDFYRGLKTLCTKYNQVTGKVPSAADAWK